jgi:transcriptional regulator with XRE-family HTH domain
MFLSTFAASSLTATNWPEHTAGVRAIDYVGEFLRTQTGDWGDLTRLKKKTGLTHSQLSTMRQGKGNPTIDRVDRIAAAFGVEIPDIFSRRLARNLQSGDVPSGAEPDTIRTAVSYPVTAPPDLEGGPFSGGAMSSPSPLPSSPSHTVLYGLIGTLSDEQADQIIEDVLTLVRRAQGREAPPPNKKK